MTPVEFKENVVTLFRNLKRGVADPRANDTIPIYRNGILEARWRPVTYQSLNNPDWIKFLAEWRQKNIHWFNSQAPVTLEGTKLWMERYLLDVEDRILFMIETLDGEVFGHEGLYRFHYDTFDCELDNLIRGKPILPGIVTYGELALMNWVFEVLGVETLYLKAFWDNAPTIRLHEKCGFKIIEKIPLEKQVPGPDRVEWVEIAGDFQGQAEQYFAKMVFQKADFRYNP